MRVSLVGPRAWIRWAFGHCTRPPQLDCAYETSCENCAFFQTSIEFRPTLQAQHDDAATIGQHERTALFSQLLDGLDDLDTDAAS